MPQITQPDSATYRDAVAAVGDVPAWLKAQREAHVSYGAMVVVLARLNVDVSYETLRAWCIRLGIEDEKAS